MLSFYIKFWTDRQTGIKTDRRTTVKQYTPDLSMHWGGGGGGGHKKANDQQGNEILILLPTKVMYKPVSISDMHNKARYANSNLIATCKAFLSNLCDYLLNI